MLSDYGSLWITIDDNEAHYLKVLCDEVFGRSNFLTTICWEKIYTLKNSAKHFSAMHDFVLVFAKNIEKVSLFHLERTEKQNAGFRNLDDDSRGDDVIPDFSSVMLWSPTSTRGDRTNEEALFGRADHRVSAGG